MRFQEIKKIAKSKGVKATHTKKGELIRMIQRAEGNFDCFGSAKSGYCDQIYCSWREDCLIVSKE